MEKKVTITESQVFEVLRAHEDLTIADICTKLGCSDFSVRKHVKALMERKVVEVFRADHQNYYSAAPAYRAELKNVAGPRVIEFKPLGIYDMKSFQRLAEGSRNGERGMV